MFPMTITLTSQAQLAAVLAAMKFTAPAEAQVPSTEQMAAALSERVKTQHAAVDETAGLTQKDAAAPAGKSAKADPAPSKPTAKAVAADAQEQSTGKPAPQPSTEKVAGASSAAEIPYEQVAKAITDKVKTDRPAAIAALAKFDAKRGTDLKPEQYAEFLAALEA